MADSSLLCEIFERDDLFPQLSTAAIEVNKLLDQPDTTAQDLAEVIMQDPGLTSRILKLCNSSVYGFSRKIETISQAVAILGHRELKEIIFTVMSHGMLDRPVEGYALERGDLWKNAMTCAFYARHIAQKVNYTNSELCFIAGLLKDLGKIALESYIRDKGPELEAIARQHKVSYADAEAILLGDNHANIGRKMAEKWSFPESLTLTIGFRHTPSQLPPNVGLEIKQLVAIVHLAEIFTSMHGAGTGKDGLMYTLDDKALLYLRINPDELELLYFELCNLDEAIQQLQSSFK
jgi:HD-like signal output (HDOD) protein